MSFSQTSGQPLKNRPVICPEPSKGWGAKTVPASALCAPGHRWPRANSSQAQLHSRQSYSPPGRLMRRALRWPSCPAMNNFGNGIRGVLAISEQPQFAEKLHAYLQLEHEPCRRICSSEEWISTVNSAGYRPWFSASDLRVSHASLGGRLWTLQQSSQTQRMVRGSSER